MHKKIQQKFIYKGLGFPIELHNVEVVMINGDYAPKIDIREIADKAIRNLILIKSRLTGDQIRFIRSYLSVSLRKFAEIVNESHTAVKKWELFGESPTNMDPNIETRIRLYLFDKILVKNKEDKIKFYENYHAINNIIANPEKSTSRYLEIY